jgi:hypothetical protein
MFAMYSFSGSISQNSFLPMHGRYTESSFRPAASGSQEDERRQQHQQPEVRRRTPAPATSTKLQNSDGYDQVQFKSSFIKLMTLSKILNEAQILYKQTSLAVRSRVVSSAEMFSFFFFC